MTRPWQFTSSIELAWYFLLAISLCVALEAAHSTFTMPTNQSDLQGGRPGSSSGSNAAPIKPAEDMTGAQFPFLLVNVGSGVSILLVTSPTTWQRVSGSSIGGGTFYGLCNMLTGYTSFDEMMALAAKGSNVQVDLTVGDIYGGDYDAVGLPASTIASSMARPIACKGSAPRKDDLVRSPAVGRAPFQARSASAGRIQRPPAAETTLCLESPRESSPRSTRSRSGTAPTCISRRSQHSSSASRHSMGSPADLDVGAGAGAAVPSILPRIRQPSPDGSSDEGSSGPAKFKASAADMAKGLLLMVSNNVAQLAYHVAQMHSCRRVYFVGNFLRHNNTIAMHTLSEGIAYWSGGKQAALFLKHEGYCGALGVLLQSMPPLASTTDQVTSPEAPSSG